jgi:hypothetical protein
MLLNVERDAERAIFEKPEYCLLRPGKRRKQMHRLGEHRLTHEKRRVELLDSLGYPALMTFRPVQKSEQRSRINNGGAHAGRSL